MQKQKSKRNIFGGHRMLLAGILCLFGFCLLAQKPVQSRVKKTSEDTTKVRKREATPQKQPAKSKVYLIHSDLLRKDSRNPDAQVVVGNVVFRHDSVYMYCDSAYYYDKISSFEAFSNVKMNQGDTLFLYGDRLYYDGNTQIAEVRMNVRMENRNTTLLTDSLNYDRVYNLGYFFDGGTLMDEQNVLTSEWGEYNPGTKQSVFNYNVKLVNPQFTLTSDTLEYNTASKVANIVGPSDILSDNNQMESFHQQCISMQEQTISLRIVDGNGLIGSKRISSFFIIKAVFSRHHILVNGIGQYHITECFTQSFVTVIKQRVTRQLFSLVCKN